MSTMFDQAQIRVPEPRTLVAATATMSLRGVVDPAERIAYIEFSSDVPMVNVIAAIRTMEQRGVVVFDLLDNDLIETFDERTRIHGMFVDDLR